MLAALKPGAPVHMHLAETPGEVAEVMAVRRAGLVEWMMENVALSSRWCLIHLTQMLPAETRALARTGAVAGPAL